MDLRTDPKRKVLRDFMPQDFSPEVKMRANKVSQLEERKQYNADQGSLENLFVIAKKSNPNKKVREDADAEYGLDGHMDSVLGNTEEQETGHNYTKAELQSAAAAAENTMHHHPHHLPLTPKSTIPKPTYPQQPISPAGTPLHDLSQPGMHKQQQSGGVVQEAELQSVGTNLHGPSSDDNQSPPNIPLGRPKQQQSGGGKVVKEIDKQRDTVSFNFDEENVVGPSGGADGD